MAMEMVVLVGVGVSVWSELSAPVFVLEMEYEHMEF